MSVPVKILVLEDDHGITDLLKISLEPGGFQLSVESSRQRGLELLERLKPDVIILVLDANDPDDLVVCRQYRQSCTAPILVLSSNGKPNFAEQALNVGADDYLVKPTTGKLVVASLNKLARRARAERQAHLPGTDL